MSNTNLPLALTSFIGRERDCSIVKELLSSFRLVTLTGPGGCGKTRLALQIASQISSSYESAWLVELAPLHEAALLPQFVVQALELQPVPDLPPTELLVNHINARKMLLILDNCEHLADSCAELILQLLSQAPNLRILATSREALAIEGESIYPVPGLAFPTGREYNGEDEQNSIDPKGLTAFDAVNLFVDRARSINPQFVIAPDNAMAIVEICRRLDGIPLALELASARLNVLTIHEIASRLSDRFGLLTAKSRRGVDPRHLTLRAAIDWSYDLLTANEQALLRRMAVFTAGCTLELLEVFYAGELHSDETALNLISSLVNKSLVVAETTGRAQIRYRLLETVRQYLLEKLDHAGEMETWRDCHLNLFMARAEEGAPKLGGTYQQLWLNWMDDEHDNLRAALAWALASEEGSALEIARLESGLRIASALNYYWTMKGVLLEGMDWLRRLLARSDNRISLDVRVNAIVFASFMAMFLGDGQLSLKYGREAVALAETAGSEGKPLMAFALAGLASGEKTAGDYAAAFETGERVVAVNREIGPPLYLGMALISQGEIALYMGNYAIARERWSESLSLAQKDGDTFRIAYCLNYLGDLARMEQDYPEADAKYRESEALLRKLNTPGNLASILSNLGFASLYLGEVESARAHFHESMVIYQETQNKRGMVDNLVGLGAIAVKTGIPSAGVRLLAAAEAISGLPARSTWPPTRMESNRYLDLARTKLTNSDFLAEQATGRDLTLEQAVDCAMNLPFTIDVISENESTVPEPTKGLTGREREIAVLISQGKTNSDIATELFLSKRTIETHVSHILSKLGLFRRAQIVRWAFDHGLVKGLSG